MSKEERQNSILQLIEHSNGEELLQTHAIAKQFGVSEMTIRRDLKELSDSGRLRRQHGGASPIPHFQEQEWREIGILLVSTTGKYADPFFNAILEGADRKLQQLGYRIAYINTRAEITTASQIHDLLESRHVAGMILLGYIRSESMEYLRTNVRALIQTTDSIGPELDTITFDGYYGIRQMVDHLIENGYQRLGFITGRHDQRRQAFLDSVQARGLPMDDELNILMPFGLDGWTPELGYQGVQQLMKLKNPPDAIVCASDRIAIGALQWLHQHNFRVPDDVAITGFDNLDQSAFTAPSLTTVHVHKQLMGELAAERVVKQIENEHEIPLLIQTPTYLVIRESSGSKK